MFFYIAKFGPELELRIRYIESSHPAFINKCCLGERNDATYNVDLFSMAININLQLQHVCNHLFPE